MRRLGRLRGQRLVVERLGRHRVQRERELVPPAELEPRLGQGVVPFVRARVALGEVGGVRGDLVGDHAGLHVVLVGQAQVLLGRDVAEHGGAVAGDLGGADGRGDVVIARGNVGDQRAERVERGALAEFLLALHVLPDQVERDVARALPP